MKTIDSQALWTINRALGITGVGAQRTELMDGHVDQVLSVGRIVCRGRTQAGTEGIYTVSLQMVHTVADTLVVAFNPYAVGATGRIAPYPDPMPPGFDIWLLYVTGIQEAGSSVVNVALRILYPAAQQGFGLDDSGAAVVIDADMPVARFDSVISTSTPNYLITEGGEPIVYPKIRLPRSAGIQLQAASVSSAATEHTLHLVLGVFPTALGQDGVV